MNDEEEKGGDLVEPDFGAINLGIKERVFCGCKHLRVILDPDLRQIECRDCKKVLDPIEVLLQYAMKERQLHYRRETVRDLDCRIEKLSAEEKRIKSRIRYAKEKVKR